MSGLGWSMARRFAPSIESVHFFDTTAEVAINFTDGSQLQFELVTVPKPKPVGYVDSEAHELLADLKHITPLSFRAFVLVFQDGSNVSRQNDGTLSHS